MSIVRNTEISKPLEMHLFLFDDILLLTKIKKMSRKVGVVNIIRCQCRHGRGSNFQNPTQPNPRLYWPNPTQPTT